MGADLFDSNVAAMASALVIAQFLTETWANTSMVFCYAILGLISSILSIATARIGKNGNPTNALNSSTYVTTGIFLVLTALATAIFEGFSWRIWGASSVGLLVSVIIGLAEMGNLGEETIRIADELDSAGNTVKAVTKGFSIGAAGLTVISLLGAFMAEVNEAIKAAGRTDFITVFDIMDPTVFFGILVGAAIPAVFSAMLILGVDKNAQRMVAEIRRQFKEIVGLKEGTAKPEYDKCIDIATTGALRELIPAGLKQMC